MLRFLRHGPRAVFVALGVLASCGAAWAGQSLSVTSPVSLSADQDQRRAVMENVAADRSVAVPAFFQSLVKADEGNRLPADVPVLRVVFPQAVFFDTDRSDIRADAAPALDAVAETLRQDRPNLAVFVVGHTDSRGSAGHNYPLSVARAEAVANALKQIGVGTARLWRIGFGQTLPIASDDTPDGMARNRRVEFIMASDPQAVAAWLATQIAATCGGDGPSAKDCRAMVASVGAFPAVDLDRGGKADITIADGSARLEVEAGPPLTLDLTGSAKAKAAAPAP